MLIKKHISSNRMKLCLTLLYLYL